MVSGRVFAEVMAVAREFGEPALKAAHDSEEASSLARSLFVEREGPEALRRKDAVIDGMRTFASKFTDGFPQVSPEGRFQYAFGGSIGTTLGTTARKIELLRSSVLPEIELGETLHASSEAQAAGYAFARQAGDVDVASTHEYATSLASLNASDGWRLAQNDLWKAWADEGDRAIGRQAFRQLETESFMPMPHGWMDVRRVRGGDNFGFVDVGTKKVIVLMPDSALAYKVQQGLFRTSISSKENYVSDVDHLFDAANQLYTRDHLVRTVSERIFPDMEGTSETQARDFRHRPIRTEHQAQSRHLKGLLQDVAAIHPDAGYLPALPDSKGLALDYLRALARFPEPSAKQEVANYFEMNSRQWVGHIDGMFDMIHKVDPTNPMQDIKNIVVP